ncbi:MAG: acetylglutamate kinase [Candidatus Methanoplasma sp.]|jgi:acetylglutamate kinase|nr:acetylglutamate kinase [Candidatus Methanoplasma sp.]
MKIFVVKFGGNAISGKEDMMRLSKEVAELVKKGLKIVLVHGGGPEISAEMEKRGLQPEKVAGLRITDEKVLEVVEEVLGKMNKYVTENLAESDVAAIGMPGYLCTLCKKKEPFTVNDNGKEVTVDLGLVGEVVDVNPDTLLDLLKSKVTPVIYPIGEDDKGNRLNVNADTMAAGIAAGIECEELITITDVPGILLDVKDPNSKVDKLTLDEVDVLISKGVISGGMIPKVEACRSALNAGVKAVRMVNGKDPRSILTDIMKNVPHGTVITK